MDEKIQENDINKEGYTRQPTDISEKRDSSGFETDHPAGDFKDIDPAPDNAVCGGESHQTQDKAKKSSPAYRKETVKGNSRKQTHPILKEILDWVGVLAVAVVAALCINTFIIANSTVPTGSMEDTIEEGDRVIGLRLSYTFGEPERGDIAIFKFGWICRNCGAQGEGSATDYESCPNCGESLAHPATLYYLKRVIGLPGDTIEIKREGTVRQGDLSDTPGLSESMGDDALLAGAAVYVNGEKIDEPYLREPMLYTGDMTFEVPEGCYFMLGDNRNNSLDARYWQNPYITKDNMVAKVLFRYFPNPSLLK